MYRKYKKRSNSTFDYDDYYDDYAFMAEGEMPDYDNQELQHCPVYYYSSIDESNVPDTPS